MDVELAGIEQTAVPDLETLVQSLDESGDLGDLVGQLRGALLDRGLVAGAVVLDGARLTAEDEQRQAGRPVSDFDRLQVEVAGAVPFVRGLFDECRISVSALAELKDRISQDIRTGKIKRAFEVLRGFSESFSVVLSAYRHGLVLLKSTGVADAGSVQGAEERLEGLEVAFQEILNGVNRGDHVLISDSLEYELPEQLEGLESELRSWSKRLDASTVG